MSDIGGAAGRDGPEADHDPVESVERTHRGPDIRLPESPAEDLGSVLIKWVVHPLITVATPVIIVFFIYSFVARAFAVGFEPGIRSLAGALLPLVLMTFVYLFNKDLLDYFAKVNLVVGFVVSLFWGLIVMGIVAVMNILPARAPIGELALSGSVVILVFS